MRLVQILGPIVLLRIVLGFATAVAVFYWRRHAFWRFSALVGAALIVIAQAKNLNYLTDSFSDMTLFWRAGDALRHGRDPYLDIPILHSPNTLPLFECFSLIPLPIMGNLWKLFNLVGCLLLIPLSARYLRLGSVSEEVRFSPGQLLALSVLLGFSNASMENINGGQLHVLVALSVLATLLLRESRHPAWAGLTASLAFIKINTALPLMPLLVNKKSDLKLVIVLGLSILVQTAIAAWPDKLMLLIGGGLRNIAALSIPGGGNDYAYTGPACAGIVSINHWLYRLGLTDRPLITILQLIVNLGFGAWLTWMCWSGRISQQKSACVFCLYAVTFLYHRIYDTVLLALPLAYAFDQFQRQDSYAKRGLMFAAGLAIVGVHYTPESLLYKLSQETASLDWIVRAGLLPLPFWLILFSMGLMLLIREAKPSEAVETGSNSTIQTV